MRVLCYRHQIKAARPVLEDMEIEKRLDMTQVTRLAIQAVEESGIVFIDEVDKVCTYGMLYSTAPLA